MHIDSIQLFRVPLRSMIATAEQLGPLESVFVSMWSDRMVGLGEVTLAQAPLVCAEWSAGAFACLRDWMAPALVGRAINSGEALQNSLGQFQGNARAKAALDMAWWNLAATMQDKPLYQLLGGTRIATRMSTSVGVMDSTDELFAQIRSSLEAGCEVVTLKYRPGWELEMVRAVRQAFPSEAIAIDCDGLCTLGQMEMFYRLEDFHLVHIEQPLGADDLVGHAMLQSAIRTPICLDQSVTSLERVEQAIDLDSCRQVKINPGRVGGLTPALAIRAACEAARIPCALGGAPQGAIAAYTTAALATLTNFSQPSDTLSFDLEPWLISDETTALEKNQAGKIEFLPPEIPGPGILVDVEVLANEALEQATIR